MKSLQGLGLSQFYLAQDNRLPPGREADDEAGADDDRVRLGLLHALLHPPHERHLGTLCRW